jgi:type II secretory pathway pseudopilin PulG
MRCVPRGRSSAGFSLVEVAASGAVLSIALLGYAASAVGHQKAAVDLSEKGVALLTLERFVERMRADTDFTGLYGRLRPLSAETATDAALTNLGADVSLAGSAPTAYYADFDAPARLGDVTILAQVPQTTVGGLAALRENASAPRYGLPADLNGDGVIDGNSRNADYMALPVVVHLRWTHAGRAPQEVVLATWLRSTE